MNCNDTKFISSCFEDTSHPNGAQSFGSNSYKSNILSTGINTTSYLEGNKPHGCGNLNSPFFAGGREDFVYSNSTISSHKECAVSRLITFSDLQNSVLTVSFSQFGMFKGDCLIDPYFVDFDQICSIHHNSVTITDWKPCF